MGGKTSTSTSQVAVPPQVLAQYASVNAAADQTAQTPFSDYTGEFVAPVNAEQTAGITATNAAANEAQPYYEAATGELGATQAATNPVNTAAEIGTAEAASPVSGADINSYLSPYLGDVLGSTEAIQNQENQQAQAGQLGDAITSGAFGSDRTGIAAANLQQQEDLANSSTIANIANTGYQSALTEANTEQQTGLAGAAQLASIGNTAYTEGANTANELGTLGTGAQSAGLAGAQAEISAGTVQQQTQQAEDTAEYNQFLQQQSYPFQVDQFLADIAEGTGSLSGSTTTTTQPGGFFSDKLLKRDIKKVGQTFDGQDVVTYKMGDDERTRIGLIAQDVEKKHPHAVGLAGGFKTVDYGKATQEAANKGHFYTGGVVPFRRIHRDTGGGLAGVLQAQQQMYANMPGSSQQRQINSTGLGGGRSLPVANAPASPPQSGASELNQSMGLVNNGYKLYHNLTAPSPSSAPTGATGVVPASAAASTASELGSEAAPALAADTSAALAPAVGAAPTAAELGANAGALAPIATTAAPAAASAAAPAAAAAVTAAAPAAADAVGTAAADTAAALAAEYAAADVGAAALMMAKGGSALRHGYDAGGMPYSGGLAGPYAEPDGDINIPDQPNTNTLKAAPAAGKQPTGLQSLLYMGNPEDTSSLVGSMFSNQAMAEGGGVAGPRRRAFGGRGTEVGDPGHVPYPQISGVAGMRAPGRHRATGGLAGRGHFDDGGTADDDSMTTDDANVTASGTPANASSAPATGGGLAGWWGRNKGTVLPILAGIGAAGTTPTVHPGVALAAGLEAAANDYVPTQEGLAKAQETQALAQAQQLENVPLGVKARIAQSIPIPGVAGQNASAPSSGGLVPRQPSAAPQPTTANPAPATIASTASPVAPAQPVGAPARPAAAQPSGSSAQTAAGLDAQNRARFFVNTAPTPEEQQRIQDAAAQDWAVGGTMNTQRATIAYHSRVQRDQQNNQNQAQQEADAAYAQATDPTAAPAAQQAALVRYNALRQWTGDGTSIEGGIVKNTRTNQPEIGAIAQQGLTPEQAAQIQIEESEPVDTGARARTPLSTWAAQQGITLPSTAVGAPPAPAISTPSQGAAPSSLANIRTPPRAAGAIPAAQALGRGNAPDFSSAPAAPAWAHDSSVVVPEGQDPKAYADAENGLIAESGRLQETQSDIIKTQRMLNLLPSAKTGPGSDTMAMAQTVLGNLTGSQFVSWLNSNPSAYAILQKSLGQQALESRLKEMQSGGASVRLGAMQDNLILNKLSASPEMPKSAISGILNWQLEQDNWDLGRETAIPQYLSQGRDARYFNNIYPQQKPLSQSLTVGAPPGTTVARGATGDIEAVTSQAEYDALPKGARYQWNGRTLVKQ